MAATKEAEKLQAREAIVIVVGARPIRYQRKIVRDLASHFSLSVWLLAVLPPMSESDELSP
jgi:hypothetical protein